MTKDDFFLDELERTQLQRTRRRRGQRSRQRRLFAVTGVALLGLITLGLPSLISHTPIASNLLARFLQPLGFDSNAQEIQFGWITPLKISQLQLRGLEAGSTITIDEFTTEATLPDLLGGWPSDFGSISLRGVEIESDVVDGQLALRRDLRPWMEQPAAETPATGTVALSEVTCRVRDASGDVWQLTQFAGEVNLNVESIETTFAGLLSDPAGDGGSVEGSFRKDEAAAEHWRVELACDSLPLSVFSMAREHLADLAGEVPHQLAGDVSGTATLESGADGATRADLKGVTVKNFVASDSREDSRVWRNELATFDGELLLRSDRVFGRRLHVTTDFAELTFDGAFSRQMTLAGSKDNPVQWLDSLQGTASASIDLAAFDEALPGVIPLRDGVQLVSGRMHARTESVTDAGARRARFVVHSDAIHARAGGGAVVIEPIDLTATVRNDGAKMVAEQFRLLSSFASAVGQGELRSGTADLKINFGRLSAMLRPLVKISTAGLAGSVEGSIAWSVTDENRWALSGSGTADDLLLAIEDGKTLRRPKLTGTVEAEGRWDHGSLEQLTAANVTVRGSGMDLELSLAAPVDRPSSRTLFPLDISGRGRAEEFIATFRPWMPESLQNVRGGVEFDFVTEVSSVTARIVSIDATLSEPTLDVGDRTFRQPHAKFSFAGEYTLPANHLVCRSLTIEADAFTAAAQGSMVGDKADMELAWKADLQRLQSSTGSRVAQTPTVRPVAFRQAAVHADDRWWLLGRCDGNLLVRRQDRVLVVETKTTATDFAVLQPAASAAQQFVGPRRASATPPYGSAAPSSGASAGSHRVVWAEPEVHVNGTLRYDLTSGDVAAQSLQISSNWLATTVEGQAKWTDAERRVSLRGPAKVKMQEVAARLTPLCGTQVEATGIHDTQLDVQIQEQPGGEIGFRVGGTLGWEAAAVAGVDFGRTSIPVEMTETSVRVDPPAIVPVGDGRLHVGGQVNYRPGPLWLQAKPGLIADSIRLTPEMTNRWLKYIAPLAADATRINGRFSASLDEAIVVFDDLSRSRVVGRLEIEGVEMLSGPLTNRIIAGVEQLKAFRSLPTFDPDRNGQTKLVSLPPQTVEFALRDNVVHHRRLEMQIDRARVVTEGNVSLDGDLDLIAQVPLDPRWLGRDLQMLAGTAISLPINGTFARPYVDPTAVRAVAEQFGRQVVQGAAENFLQEQLDKGQQQINRSLEKGMERLGLEKVFGF